MLGTDVSAFPLDGPLADVRRNKAVKRSSSSWRNAKTWPFVSCITGRRPAGASCDLWHRDWNRRPAWALVCERRRRWLQCSRPDASGWIIDFARLFVPELQSRKLFRTAYEGVTLRENLSVSRPSNQHATRAVAAE